MKRRLPQATVRSFSPLGYLHSVALDGGVVAEPLGAWTTERVSELERDLDFVGSVAARSSTTTTSTTASGTTFRRSEAEHLRPSRFFIEGLGEQAERKTPVAWHSVGIPFELEGEFAERIRVACSRRPYVSVRDQRSRARLIRAGVQREVVVVPDSALLLRRLVPPDVLARRLDYLKAIHAFPDEGRPLVLQGSRALLPYADELGRSSRPWSASRTSPCCSSRLSCHGDGEFAEAISLLPAGRSHVPVARGGDRRGRSDRHRACARLRRHLAARKHRRVRVRRSLRDSRPRGIHEARGLRRAGRRRGDARHVSARDRRSRRARPGRRATTS